MTQQKSDYIDTVEIDGALDELPTEADIEETVENLKANGFDVIVSESAEDALNTLQSLIPAG